MEYQRAVPLVLAGAAAAGQSAIRGMRGESAVDVPDQKDRTHAEESARSNADMVLLTHQQRVVKKGCNSRIEAIKSAARVFRIFD